VVADIPGLIEGAHEGAGLGTQFLRHIERTRILIHLIDVGTIDREHPLEPYRAVNRELKSFNPQLTQKPQIVVINKMDLPAAQEAADRFAAALDAEPVILISAIKKKGIKRLISRILELLDRADDKQ
jgi:GTP-binding protein